MNTAARTLVVLDTNIVLDLFVFEDPAVDSLRHALDSGSVQWLATRAMRDELARVLGYRNIVGWLDRHRRDPQRVGLAVLARFDREVLLVEAASAAPQQLRCSDPDDQCFIDLAAAHDAELVSKDRAVTEAWRRR